jgi:NAD-dependent deacetylase
MFAGERSVLRMLQARIVAQRIAEARRVVALTGAGIATASGVPDFRGPKGIYVTRAYPEDVFDFEVFLADPSRFYAFARELLLVVQRAQPSFTHELLARVEAAGRLLGIVTQNIDGLHQRAGSQRVIEIHGGFTRALCLACERQIPGSDLAQVVLGGEIPRCDACGGLVKPDVVFFGEPVRDLEGATQLVEESDLLLVIGSSLTVYPAAGLPAKAGGGVVIVTRGPLTAPARAMRVDADIDPFFRQVEAELGGESLSELRRV